MKSKYFFQSNTIRAGCFYVLLMGIVTAKPLAQGTVEMSPGITTEATGMLHTETNGHWLNQGILLPGSSTLTLYGEANQLLQQNGGVFHHLTINKSAGDVTLMSNINISGGVLSLVNQDLLLNGHLILFDPIATLHETTGNTVKGPMGYLSATRMISAPAGDNVAGLGLMITSDDHFGTTEIRRGHASQSANGHEGIQRYFDVLPEFNVESDATIQMRYDESELNGNSEAQLKMYRSPDAGVNWIEVEGVLNETDNWFEAPAVSSFSRFTLSSYCLETCIATEAIAQPAIVFLNTAGLGSIEAADINNGSTGACGIDSMQVIPEAFTCADVGMQEVVLIVTDNNGCSTSAVSMVEVVDVIPPEVLCKNITVSVGESCYAAITPGDIDDGSSDACGITMAINVSTFDCDDLGPNLVVLTVTDPSGNTGTCEAIVTVETEINVECADAMLPLNEEGSAIVDPFDLITGDPGIYEGYTFSVDPNTFSCEELGEHLVTLTSTDPSGEVTICQATVTIYGPDADCDGVADQCDVCDGGNDLLDSDYDGMPDCADWDGWGNLIEEWQCANNKVFLCHDGIVICVNQNAVQSHLDHGDFLGACDAVFCDDPPAILKDFHADRINKSGVFRVEAVHLDAPNLSSNSTYDEVLTENRPNPFFPETTIRFYLPQQDWIHLVVYGMTGAPIGLLAQGHFHSGWHDIIFDGTDHADGVYIYVLRTVQACRTGTMVLAR